LEPRILLLLGSFDEKTKAVLNSLKNELAREFSGIDLYCFLLDDVEIFSDENYDLILERYDHNSFTAFIFDKASNILNVEDVQIDSNDLQSATYEFIRTWCLKTNRPLPNNFVAYSIFNKLENLFKFARLILIVRNEEKTRGGEYIEFAYGVAKYSNKFYFVAKQDVILSTMVVELIKRYGIKMLFYHDNRDLNSRLVEIVKTDIHLS